MSARERLPQHHSHFRVGSAARLPLDPLKTTSGDYRELSVIAFVKIALGFADRGQRDKRVRRDRDLNQERIDRMTAGQQPVGAYGSTAERSIDPHLEFKGEVYFFCSIDERDACMTNLEMGELRPLMIANVPVGIERLM